MNIYSNNLFSINRNTGAPTLSYTITTKENKAWKPKEHAVKT